MSLKLNITSNCHSGTVTYNNVSHTVSNVLEWEVGDNWKVEKIAALKEKISDEKTDITACSICLLEMSFDKQLYRPCEIHARMQIAVGSTTQDNDKSYCLFKQSVLDSNFKNCKVSLKNDSDTIADNYYVDHIIPEYSETSLYVDFVIYSPDHALTTDIASEVYVAKKLFKEIAKDKLSDIDHSIQLMNGLYKLVHAASNGKPKVTDEYIQPYLVRYNESFYDFLCRTANRWGEFVYFEDGALRLGRNIYFAPEIDTNTHQPKKDANGKIIYTENENVRQIETYKSLSYFNGNPEINLSPDDANTVTNDDYLATVTRDAYIKAAGDLNAKDPAYSHKVFQSFLGIKSNVFDWGTNMLIDHATIAGENKAYLDEIRKKYNDEFFDKTLFPNYYSTTTKKDDWKAPANADDYPQYSYTTKTDNSTTYIDWSKDVTYCQFADIGSSLTADKYKTILGNELSVGSQMICIDLGEKFQSLRLGECIQFAITNTNAANKNPLYVVIRVEGFVKKEPKIDRDNKTGNYYIQETTSKMQYRVYAVPAVSGVFYPPMIPSGHVRSCGPQLATVMDNNDPALKNRYRLKLKWQGSSDTEYTPWVRMSREMIAKESGAVWQLEKDTEVLVDFTGGNAECPYIVGALQDKDVARTTHFNNLDLTTPAGHAIRLTDGYGAGVRNFAASMIPIWGLVKASNPTNDKYADVYGSYDKYYEGGMELTDKFGIYSIKGSTDERKISIRSPYGDVNIDAFTGISINAPNGDIKIRGKNVSIEAGNNLSLTSGKNLANGLFGAGALTGGLTGDSTKGDYVGGTVTSILKVIGDKAISLVDLPVLRYGLEVILRPVTGVMDLRAMSFMKLHSGITVEGAHKPIHKGETWGGAADWAESNNIWEFLRQGAARFTSKTDYGFTGGDFAIGNIATKEDTPSMEGHWSNRVVLD